MFLLAFDHRRPHLAQLFGIAGDPTPEETGKVIAVSVNGTIAGVSPTFVDSDGPARFAVLMPDFLFMKGSNTIRLFTVEGRGADAVLHPLQVDGLG